MPSSDGSVFAATVNGLLRLATACVLAIACFLTFLEQRLTLTWGSEALGNIGLTTTLGVSCRGPSIARSTPLSEAILLIKSTMISVRSSVVTRASIAAST